MEEEARRKDIDVKLGPFLSFFLLACKAHCSMDCLLAGGRVAVRSCRPLEGSKTRLSTLLVPFLEPEQARASMGIPTQSTKDTEEVCHKAASTGWII